MTQTERQKTYLKDYTAPTFQIPSTHLAFDFRSENGNDFCRVTSTLKLQRRPGTEGDLWLDGEELVLEDIKLNGAALAASAYVREDKGLKLLNPPSEFTLQTTVKLEPKKNTALEGLYGSGAVALTQCEPQGFRRITYYLDRPDVMSSFEVTIEADKATMPVLLSNGDCVERKDLGGGRHFTKWVDPFKKPCYLFALVAGPLAVLKDTYTTGSGKKVALEIYTNEANIPRCGFAMESLKRAMKWDEERFGLEYDLSTYMIVSTDDFNAGAMENKGLNIFNSRLVLADPKSATDYNYHMIEAVVGHEYFHNWTGNRVTLRDWFHLSLKEGLTVFRDQEFSMDMVSRDLVRIDSVIDLRESQFAEDDGPNAHPIRPESCYAVDNFFTSTIYEKGSEVIRMMQTMVGRPGFRQGMDLYFKRHDGQAVIIEDFAAAISDANKQDWSQFKRWYSQAGTPRVKVTENFQGDTYTLTLEQSCPSTPGQTEKLPFHIPLIVGLVTRDGKDLELTHPSLKKNTEGKTLIHLMEPKQTFEFKGLKEKPLLSLNREFSAPIVLEWNPPVEELFALYKMDNDAFNRFEAGQKLQQLEIAKFIDAAKSKSTAALDPRLIEAQIAILNDARLDNALKKKMVERPSLASLAQSLPGFDSAAWKTGIDAFRRAQGQALATVARDIYTKLHGKSDGVLTPEARGERALKNWALGQLCNAGEGHALAEKQFRETSMMVDQEIAFALLMEAPEAKAREIASNFYDQWNSDSLVMNKWWSLQAQTEAPWTFARVQELLKHPAFNMKNPNSVYALLGRFSDNLIEFHAKGGETYRFFAQELKKIDALNPQVAARLSGAFDFCPRVSPALQAEAKKALDGLLADKLSPNAFEILSNARKALGA
ncbi:MAG: aminopeptidase N [Bdellovibrionaceae bacterium]|nr:aminopeptidase N [Pseudobdellovibrionaceae bacterium]